MSIVATRVKRFMSGSEMLYCVEIESGFMQVPRYHAYGYICGPCMIGCR